MEVRLKSRYWKDVDNPVPMEGIRDLAVKALKTRSMNTISGTLSDIHRYSSRLGRGRVYIHRPKMGLTELSCIEYINKHTISEYLNALVGFTSYSLLQQDRSVISVLEEHFKHLHGLWMVKSFKYDEDTRGAELLMVFLVDAIGMLRGYHDMGKSEVILACQDQAKNKCIVWNCPNPGKIIVLTALGPWRFCDKCNEKIMKSLPNVHRVTEMLRQSDGEMVVIKTWEEFKEKLMPEFLQMLEDSLDLAGDTCVVCGEKAVATGIGFKPYCAEHMEFPRSVYKVALRGEMEK